MFDIGWGEMFLIGIVALDTIQVINPLIAGVIVFLAGQRASRRDMTRG